MTLPSSGTITIGNIVSEFGGDGDIEHYYKGGPCVPYATPGAIPGSGQISLSNFYGTQNIQESFDVPSSSTTWGSSSGAVGYALAGNIPEAPGSGDGTNPSDFGSISPSSTSSVVWPGQTITALAKDGNFNLYLTVTGGSPGNWSIMYCYADDNNTGPYTFNASDGYQGGSSWVWSGIPGDLLDNPSWTFKFQ